MNIIALPSVSGSGTVIKRGRKKLPDSEVHHNRNPTYRVWLCMKTRCYNFKHSSSKRYGREGVTVCAEWLNDFEAFRSSMGDRPTPTHTLDRLDNGEGYSPSNCRWATALQQGSNRRTNVFQEWKGQRLTVTQIARSENVDYPELMRLLGLGHPLCDAVERINLQGRHFHERAVSMGATGKSKSGRTRNRRV